MKRFLKKLLFFSLPVILFLLLAEFLLRNIPNDYALKASVYREQGKEFETLILGNSYAMYDLDPAWFTTRTFNGGHLAQSLDIDAALYQKEGPLLTRLKYLIIPISDMSFLFKLGDSNESWRIANYPVHYKIYPSLAISDYFEIFNLPFSINRNRLIAWYVKKKTAVTVSSLGFGTNFKSSRKRNLDTTALESGQVHTIRDPKNFTEEKNALEQIVETCYQKGIRVILFIPPAYSGYASNIDPVQLATTQNTCQYFKEKFRNVSYFNLLNDTSFTADDYFDAVHLNEIGAKKLSLRMDKFLNDLGPFAKQ